MSLGDSISGDPERADAQEAGEEPGYTARLYTSLQQWVGNLNMKNYY